MKVYQYEEFPELLIKFGKEEHLKDLLNGKVYMNESGYFRKIDDNFRGDKFDGKSYVSMNSPEWSLQIGPTKDNDEVIIVPGTEIKDYTNGFVGDDKIPLFCCSEINENTLEKTFNDSLIFKESFIEKMEQFGTHYVIFKKLEFADKMYAYIQNHNIGGRWSSVVYKPFDNPYDLSAFDKNRTPYDAFFIKDISYQYQNEWRIILKPSNNPIISKRDDHYIATIPPLEQFHIGKTEELKKFKFTEH